ncbi:MULTISPECIES: ATP-binding cassette domain-containing protein [Streptococcus]|uniref:ATP-binding cassette domain-containing protein n=1 Tax=Streptococcus caledonicus TaxID=2614158 RepID=A0ABW0UBF3_9STRE|nr:ATP-binding cassette domain-containing protein [Streptococcus sp. S784/96/1]
MSLQVKNLNTDIFHDLNFTISNQGIFGIIGRNGVGKSTLFSIINKEVLIKSGGLQCGRISYIPNLDIFDKHLAAQDYVNLLSSDEKKRFNFYLKQMGGADYLKKKIGKYSLGMKELFTFVYSLSINSDVLILDELLDGLDETRRFRAYQILKEHSREKIILFTSHNLSEVFSVCDTVFLLEMNGLKEIKQPDVAREFLLEK